MQPRRISCNFDPPERFWNVIMPYSHYTTVQYNVGAFQNPIQRSKHTRTFTTPDEVYSCFDLLTRKQCIRQSKMHTFQAKMIGNDPNVGVRIGQAKHPGPTVERVTNGNIDQTQPAPNPKTTSTGGYKLHVANVTNLKLTPIF